MKDRYDSRGVSASKEDVHKAVSRLDQGLYPNAFCKVVPDHLTGDADQCLIMHADGAGTKSSLAYAYWKETGDLSVWKGIAQDALVMNIDDLLCVGATGPIMVSSTIGRNKRLVPGEVISEVIQGTQDFLDRCTDLGIPAYFTGGETADVGDLVRTIIVDSTIVGRMPREDVITNDRIDKGDLIVGFSSFGKANYEDEYNSGIGSNGLTSARHDVFAPAVGEKFPETYDPGMPSELAYVGKQGLTDDLEGTPLDMGKAVLSPTRTYAPVMKKVLEEHRRSIHGVVHCSGGAQTKILNFVKDLHVIKDDLFEIPPVFKRIQEESRTDPKEMYKVFNMGHRMEVIVPNNNVAEEIISIAKDQGVDAKVIGKCRDAAGDPGLTIESEWGSFTY